MMNSATSTDTTVKMILAAVLSFFAMMNLPLIAIVDTALFFSVVALVLLTVKSAILPLITSTILPIITTIVAPSLFFIIKSLFTIAASILSLVFNYYLTTTTTTTKQEQQPEPPMYDTDESESSYDDSWYVKPTTTNSINRCTFGKSTGSYDDSWYVKPTTTTTTRSTFGKPKPQPPQFKQDDQVFYSKNGVVQQAEIYKVYLDEKLEPYYAIKLSNGTIKDTVDKYLTPA